MGTTHFGDEGHSMVSVFKERIAAERKAELDKARMAREVAREVQSSGREVVDVPRNFLAPHQRVSVTRSWDDPQRMEARRPRIDPAVVERVAAARLAREIGRGQQMNGSSSVSGRDLRAEETWFERRAGGLLGVNRRYREAIDWSREDGG